MDSDKQSPRWPITTGMWNRLFATLLIAVGLVASADAQRSRYTVEDESTITRTLAFAAGSGRRLDVRNIDGFLHVTAGDVYSDFDVQLKPEPLPTVSESSSGRGRYRISRNRSMIGTINGAGPEFELRTFNSNVYVRKGPDSRR
jgi:hypothetical protein